MSAGPFQLNSLLERLIEAEVFLKASDSTLVATELGRVDVLQGLPQVPAFETLDAAAIDVDIEGLPMRVCSLEHLLAMKRASERPRDRDDLEALEAAQEEENRKA